MKKLNVFLLTILTIFLSISCEIGLGSAVDTLPPEINIETPLSDSIIRDSFRISGTWNDDGSIGSVSLVLQDTESDTKYGPYAGTVETIKNGQGTWTHTIEKELIPDGTYEVTVTITDDASHQTAIQRQITIDNTSPVLVMQRPFSKIGTNGAIENYGRVFSIDGQAADDSGIGALDVNVYSDSSLQNLLKTLTFTSIPNTISMDVAKFVQDVANDYSTIYGSTDYNAGQKTLYCKIVAYDGAKRYPADGSAQTEADLRGNATTGYYIYDDIAAEILSNYKITELYAMKKGRYAGSETARTAAVDNLARYEISSNVFTLNPKNNPTFTVAGFTEMPLDGDFAAANMSVSSGDFLTIQVEPGLDGYLLVKDSLKVKIKKNTFERYPEQTISKDGDKYKIIAYIRKEDGLVSTNTYAVEVEGHDEQGNDITTPLGIGYGFYLEKSVTTPALTVTDPFKEDAVIYNANSDSLTIKGVVNFPNEICDSGDVIVQDITGTYKWKVGTFTSNANIPWEVNIKFRKDHTETEYSTTDANGNPVVYKYLPDNEWDLYVYAKYADRDDPNEEKDTDKIMRSFIVDTKEPSTPQLIEVNDAAYNSNTWYTSQNLRIKVTSEDEARHSYKSGVIKTEYKVNNGEWTNLDITTAGFLNGLREGGNELYFRNIDGVDNVSNVNTTPVSLFVDTLPPVIRKAYLGDKDNNDNNAWSPFVTGKVLNIHGQHKKYLKLEIEENNTLGSLKVKIGDDVWYENASGTSISPAPVKTSSDSGDTSYWIWTSDTELSPVTENQTITIKIETIDASGGKGEATYKFLVDTAGPEITFTQPENNLSGETSISSPNYTLKASVSDAAGTVAETKYKITSIPLANDDEIKANAKDAATSVEWTASENAGSVNIPISINSGTGISGNVTNGTISEGQWYYYVYSKDNAGNETVGQRSFWTDLHEPDLQLIPEPKDVYNKQDLGAAESGTITISGTASDANGVTEVRYSYSSDGGSTYSDLSANLLSEGANTWSFSKTYGPTDGSGVNLPNGKYLFRIQAKDTAGKTTVKTRSILIDTNTPSITGITGIQTGWYTTRTIVPEVTVSDATSAISKVEYCIKEADAPEEWSTSTATWKPLTLLNDKWTGAIPFSKDGSHTLYFKVTDEAGNTNDVSEAACQKPVKIDTSAPVINAKYYQIGTRALSAISSETVWIDGSSENTITIWGQYSDLGSGVSGVDEFIGFYLGENGTSIPDLTPQYSTGNLPANVSGTMPDFNTYSDTNFPDKTLIKSWKLVIPNNKVSTGDLSVSGKDKAGNTGNAQLFNINKDTTSPEVNNVTVTDTTPDSSTVAYCSSSEGQPLVYWVNNKVKNTDGETISSFSIEGVSTDDNRVAGSRLLISNDSSFPENPTAPVEVRNYTNSGSPTSWQFAVTGLDTFKNPTDATKSATEVYVKIITTDYAGNEGYTGTASAPYFTIKFDSVNPSFKHGIDKKGKDVDFRIGEYANDDGDPDVGGKYQAGTWGNATSLIIRGTLGESGSGLQRVYYKVYTAIPDDTAKNNFKKNYKDSTKTAEQGYRSGYIDIDNSINSSELTRNVDYTNDDGDKQTVPVVSSFKGSISGLSEGKNYLLLLVEDKVGNICLDTLDSPHACADDVTLDEDGVDIAKWKQGLDCYSLNVDTNAPVITRTSDRTQFSNGYKSVTVTGTCNDTGDNEEARSGVDKVKVSVKIGSVPTTKTATITGSSWEATFDNNDLSGITDGETYNIDATVTDKAGLSASTTVAILQGDRVAPEANLISITPSVEKSGSSSDSVSHFVRPSKDKIKVKGSTTDTYSTTVYTWLKLVPYTVNEGVITPDTSETAVKILEKTSEPTWELEIEKGTLSISDYAGAKLYACTEDLAGNISDDDTSKAGHTASKLLTTFIFDETAPVFDHTKTAVGGITNPDTALNIWHKNRILSLKGVWKDGSENDGVGVDKIYYKLLSSNSEIPEVERNSEGNITWPFFTGTETTEGYTFTNTIQDFEDGINYIYMYAVDKLGNGILWADSATNKEPLTIKVDSIAPGITEYTETIGENVKTYSFIDSYLTGGSQISLYCMASDNNNGILQAGNYSGINSSYKKITLGGSELSNSTITFDDTVADKVIVTISESDLAGKEGFFPVAIELKDIAGNVVSKTIGTLNVDRTPPKVELNALTDADTDSNGTQVNKKITLKGNVKDTYLKEEPLETLEYTTTPDNDSSWVNLLTDTTGIVVTSSITNAADFSVTIDTEQLTDGETYYIRASAKDRAGNTGWSTGTNENPVEPLSFTVNQDTDRPVIKFKNLDIPETIPAEETAACELSVFNTTLRGTISDDDATEDAVVKSFSVKKIVVKNGVTTETDVPVTRDRDSWTITLTDGTYDKIIFTVEDNNDGSFTTGGPFNTKAALQNSPKLTDGDHWLGKKDTTQAFKSFTEFKLMVDHNPPVWEDMLFKLHDDTEAAWASSLPKLGGPAEIDDFNIFDLKLKAGDENGIKSVTAKIAGTTVTYSDSEEAANKTIIDGSKPEKKYTEWTLSGINVSSLADGAHSLDITIEDEAGNKKQETVTLMVDKAGPELDITKPTSSTTSSGSVWANGTISGAKAKQLYYAISPKGKVEGDTYSPNENTPVNTWEAFEGTGGNCTNPEENPKYIANEDSEGNNYGMDFGITWDIYFDGKVDSDKDTHLYLLNDYLVKYGITTEEALSGNSFDTLVKLYLWLKAYDDVGNVTEKAFPIIIDPQGDRPVVNFTYPESNGTVLGGNPTIYGTAEDTKGDNPGVRTVWIQMISKTHHNEDNSVTSDTTRFDADNLTSFALNWTDLSYMKAKGYRIYKIADYDPAAETNTEWDGTESGNPADYAALARLSGTAWLLEINSQGEFNPAADSEDSNPVAVRVIARDGDNKNSINFDRLIKFDANKPVISNLKLIRYGKDDTNQTDFTKVEASQMYDANLFLKGDWWLEGEVSDPQGIKELTVGSTKLVQETVLKDNAWHPIENAVENTNAVCFRYRLETQNGVGAKSIDIIAYDNAEGKANDAKKTVSVKWDNQAPEYAETKAAGMDISSKVRQKDGFYKFASKVMEPKVEGDAQSGFAYTAFYFKRSYTDGNNNAVVKLYDVLQKRGVDFAEKDISEDIRDQKIKALGSNDEVSLVTENNLYWFVKTCTTDGTMTVSLSDTSNIHVNSLVNIGGVYYLVKSITSTDSEKSITLDRNVPAGYQKAYVALAGIIDNTVSEDPKDNVKVQADGYYARADLNRDDGDRMQESVVSTDDETWEWEAHICSKNIPDGPIELHYVIFDKAGNVAYKNEPNATDNTVVKGFVCNNQPRLAGVIVKTDYTGNNVAETPIYENYKAKNYSKTSVTGSMTIDAEQKAVYDPYAKSETEFDYRSLSNEMTVPATDAEVITLRGLTEIIPEIVGGNKKVCYSYNIVNEYHHKNENGEYVPKTISGTNTHPLYSEPETGNDESGGINYDFRINDSKAIKIQLGDLIDIGDTKDGTVYRPIPFEFTFNDETEGLNLTSLSNDQKTEYGYEPAKLTVKFAINVNQTSTPTASINKFSTTSFDKTKGHIELEDDWKETDKYKNKNTETGAESPATTGQYDADPKVSGEIVIDGTAFDEKLLTQLDITMSYKLIDELDPEAGPQTVTKTIEAIATKGTSGLESNYAEGSYSANGFWFEVENKKLDNTGHQVNWKLHWNTQHITGNKAFTSKVALSDVSVTVKAINQGAPSREIAGETETDYLVSIDGHTKYKKNTFASGATVTSDPYRMDIVPYVKEVKTTLSSANTGNPSVYSRTALGHYPVYKQTNGNYGNEKDIKVYGFNLAGGSINFTGDTNNSVSLTPVNAANIAEGYTFDLPTGAKSGDATVTVNEITSLNNFNNNAASGDYNKQPNGENNNLLTDDLVFDVWDINSAAAKPKNNSAKDIMMKVNPGNGLIGFAFCNGDLYWSMPKGTENSYITWAKTRDFMQCTGFAFDQNGQSYGVAAGGESEKDRADTFNFFVKSWDVATDNYTYKDNSHSLRIGFTAVVNYEKLAKNRFQSPSIVSDGTYAFLAYYDLLTGEIRFQGGKSVPGSKGSIGTLKDNFTSDKSIKTKLSDEQKLLQVVASVEGVEDDSSTQDNPVFAYSGDYVAIGMTSDNHVVMVWYDSIHNNLMYSYTAAPDNDSTDKQITGVCRDGWSKPTPILEGAGKYCNLVVDSDDNIHVAAFDSANGDLKYVFIDDYTDPDNIIACTVDSYQTVGKELTIDVAKKGDYQIPHIGYWGNTPKKPRYAYLADPASFYATSNAVTDGAVNDAYTGIWECGIVPTPCTITTDAKRRINVGVRKDGDGLLIESSSGTSTASTESGTCYGNGTKNAVLGYGVKFSPTQDYVETAQMR